MIRQLFQQLNRYKFDGDYLNNYNTLIELIQTTVIELKKSEDRKYILFAIHLLLDVRDHILGMSYSKGYELQIGTVGKQITDEAHKLLTLLPDEIHSALSLLLDKLIINENSFTETDAIIRYCTPWSFYLLEFQGMKSLHIINQGDTFNEVKYSLDQHQCYSIENNKQPYETIYSIMDSVRTKLFIEFASTN